MAFLYLEARDDATVSARERAGAASHNHPTQLPLAAMAAVPWVAAAVRRSMQEAAAGAGAVSYAQAQQGSPAAPGPRSTARSVETLVVIVAAIVLVAVLAGVVARACGGRHVAPSGDRDVEGWVERRCRSCLDSGLPPPPATAQQPHGSSKASDAK